MPDHVPQAVCDPAGLQSFAYCYGYIRLLMQSLVALPSQRTSRGFEATMRFVTYCYSREMPMKCKILLPLVLAVSAAIAQTPSSRPAAASADEEPRPRAGQTMKPIARGTHYAAASMMPQATIAAEHVLAAGGNAFDAIVAANDNMAIGAIDAIRAAGRRIPEDVAITGFDDIPLARHLGITTVRVRIAELGERALARLLDGLPGEDRNGDELHAPELVIRWTTDPKVSF